MSEFPEQYEWTVNGQRYSGRTIEVSGVKGIPSNYNAKLVVKRTPLCGDDGIDSVAKSFVIYSSHTRIAGTFTGTRNDGLVQTIVIDTSQNLMSFPRKYQTINGLEDTCTFRLTSPVIRGIRQWIIEASKLSWNGRPPDPNCGRADARLRFFGQDSLRVEYSLVTKDNKTIYTFLGREGGLTPPLTPAHPT